MGSRWGRGRGSRSCQHSWHRSWAHTGDHPAAFRLLEVPAPPGAVALWVPVPRATHPCCGNLPCPALHRQLHVQIREAPTWEGHEFLIYRGTTLHSFFIESPHLTLGVFVHLIKNGSCLIDFIYHCCRRQHSPGMVAVLPPGTRLGPRCPLCSALKCHHPQSSPGQRSTRLSRAGRASAEHRDSREGDSTRDRSITEEPEPHRTCVGF